MEENVWAGTRLSDVTMSEVHTLEAISILGMPTMGEVALRLSVKTATLTTAIDRLERKGYCVRLRSDEDRRVIRLRLTDNGRLAVRLHALFHKKLVASTVAGLSPEEEKVLAQALAHLNDFITKGRTVDGT